MPRAAYLVSNQSEALWSSGQSDWQLFGGTFILNLENTVNLNDGPTRNERHLDFWVMEKWRKI